MVGPQEAAQEAPQREPQDGRRRPKVPQDAPETLLRELQEGPKKGNSNWPWEPLTPRWPQGPPTPKRLPRGLQEAPKEAPKRPHEASKRTPKGTRTNPNPPSRLQQRTRWLRNPRFPLFRGRSLFRAIRWAPKQVEPERARSARDGSSTLLPEHSTLTFQ